MFKNFNITIYLLLLMVSFSTRNRLVAQENAVPEYKVPYVIPNPDSILSDLYKIKLYCESTGQRQILDKASGKEISDFSVLNRNAVVANGFTNEWSYTHGVLMSSFDELATITGDNSWENYNISFFDFVTRNLPFFRRNAGQFGESASGWRAIVYMGALDDCGSIGASLIRTYTVHPDPYYHQLIDTIAQYIRQKQFRLPDGTLARHRPQKVSVWADDLYMSVPFLARMGKLTGDTRYFDDAIRQVLQISGKLFTMDKGLFDHGWNESSDGFDPRFYWGRANGWSLMAMAELLSCLPKDYKNRDKILTIYRTCIRSVTELQDGSGFWHNLLDKTDSYTETSCTAMFVYAIAKGINEGWISYVYGPVAQTGWNALATRIRSDGAVDGTCEATTFANENVYYYNRGTSIYATHGYGPVVFAGAEMIQLLKNPEFKITISNNPVNRAFHYIPAQ